MQADIKKAWDAELSNVVTGTTNPQNANERNAHAYSDAGVQSFFTRFVVTTLESE